MGVQDGSGPPVLLLHGHPQTHVMWHMVAPLLARDFTVGWSLDYGHYLAEEAPEETYDALAAFLAN
jgi:hypothetical protein